VSDIVLSDDPALLQVERVHAWLAGSYWSPAIERTTVERAIAGSHAVGAYRGGVQVGFARLISDRATFGWLADVFVDPEARGAGLGRRLAGFFLDHADYVGIRRIMLNTRDAHGVYEALGFHAPVRPDFLMERLAPGAAERLRTL
jgi:GNAT superfamily N-acetyltransferase